MVVEEIERICGEMERSPRPVPEPSEKIVYDERGRKKGVLYANGVEFPIVHFNDMCRERAAEGAQSPAAAQARRMDCFSDGFRSYANATFSGLPADFDANAIAVARSYAEGFDAALERGGGLLLFGREGVGKTHLAACVCNELLSRRRCKMTTLQALEDDHYRIGSSLRKLLENDLVVIDDLGAERATETGRANTFTVFNRLVGDGRPFIVTTCLDPAKTVQLDQARRRVMARVLQCCKVVEVAGPDRRVLQMPERMAV